MFHRHIKTNKTSPFLVNYSHQKVLLTSKLILCCGSELRQNQAGGNCDIDCPKRQAFGS